MRRSGFYIATLTALALPAFSGLAPCQAQQATSETDTAQAIKPVELTVRAVVEEKAAATRGDGSRVVGGHYGGQQETCGIGTQAYVQEIAPDGTVSWERCDGTGGACGQGAGLPLFAGSPIDGLVESSTVHGIALDDLGGGIVVTGEAILAADDGTGISTSRVMFVIRLTAGGAIVAQQVYGGLPAGTPIADGCCLDLCDDGGGGGGSNAGPECGGRDVAWLPGVGVAVTGWCEDLGGSTGSDVLVALYDDNLAELWTDVLGTAGKDVGLAVTLSDQGEVFSTGYGLAARDFFVASHTPAGVLDSYSLGGGTNDDEGRDIVLDDLGNVTVDVFVTGEATYDGQSFGDPAEDRQEFTLEVKTNDLSLVKVEPAVAETQLTNQGQATAKTRQALPQTPTEPPAGLALESYYIVIGQWGTGGLEDLLDSDNLFLHMYEGPDPAEPNHYLLRFGVVFDPSEAAFEVNSLSIELEADECYDATMWLKGYLDETFHQAGYRRICPSDQPVLVATLSSELSAALGFDGVLVPGPDDRLHMEIEMDFGTYGCPVCSTQVEEGSVDEISADPGI